MLQSVASITTKQYKLLKRNDFPELLQQIHDCPKELHIDGVLPSGPAIAIVGTRKPTQYGREQAYRLSYELAEAGMTIVSGLAYGIDAIAHRAALDAGGKTIAVLGCGLDVCYPAANQALARDIVAKGGAVLSEYQLKTPALKHHFPARNRIISGFSLGVLVPEADARSGSLITALLALDQNRTVLAVPGNITSERSAGPNNLIRAGAVPVHRTADVWTGLGLQLPVANPPAGTVQPSQSSSQDAILDQLARSAATTNQIARQTGLSAAQVSARLIGLEVLGQVLSLGGGYWMIRPGSTSSTS